MEVSYLALLDQKPTLSGIDFTEKQPPENSLGARFLATLKKDDISPENIESLSNDFHDFLKKEGWTWAPMVGGNNLSAGAKLLDGDLKSGECATPAHALAYLIKAAPPYGFGLEGEATVKTFTGSQGKGFISKHDTPLPGLSSNIKRMQGGVVDGFYFWENHKVVEYGGKFYDPNYRKSYIQLADMASAEITLEKEKIRLRDMSDYNPLNPWGILLKWGIPRLAALKISDLFYGNTHSITLYSATSTTTPAISGYYIEWTQVWGNPAAALKEIYGPILKNPLVR
ncbi:TPA: hypothetical protein L4E92_005186 [Pseudomonas aeruginosa]|nr:hypothetical protein [Pseudomonas aeruginosa]